jgi:hypothetical protein
MDFTAALWVAFFMAFFIYLYERQQRAYERDRAAWQAERHDLLDRIMAADYRLLVNGRISETVAEKPTEPTPESEWEMP